MQSFEDIQEYAQLMAAAGIHPMNNDDLNRSMANSVLSLMAIGEGKLGEDPPHAATLHLLLVSMRDGSTLDDAMKIPDRWNTDPAAQMSYAQHYSNFMILCRLAKVRLPGALLHLSTAFSPPTTTAATDIAKRDEVELKDCHSVAVRLRATSAAYYKVVLGAGRAERQASPEQLVKTHQGLRRGALGISRLQSPKYGTANAVEREEQALTIQKNLSFHLRGLLLVVILLRIELGLEIVGRSGLLDLGPLRRHGSGGGANVAHHRNGGLPRRHPRGMGQVWFIVALAREWPPAMSDVTAGMKWFSKCATICLLVRTSDMARYAEKSARPVCMSNCTWRPSERRPMAPTWVCLTKSISIRPASMNESITALSARSTEA